MKLRLIAAFVFSVIAIHQAPAMAVFYRTSELVSLMVEYDRASTGDTGADYGKAREYAGYIMGVYDVMEFTYSPPDNLTRGQVVGIVTTYLKRHPDAWNDPVGAWSVVLEALTSEIPLKKGGPESGSVPEN